MNDAFSDAALIIVGHGSTLNADSSAPVYQHGTELRRRGIFGEVWEAFLKQEPSLGNVLARTSARRVFVLPLFLSEGYFTSQAIPSALGRNLKGQGRPSQICYCAPIGTHPRMTGIILDRALQALQASPFPRTPMPEEIALFVAGHGTPRNENSRSATQDQADLIRSQDRYAQVEAVFLEEEPRVSACCRLAQVRNVVVVPFFISDGLHVAEHIPVLLGEPEQRVRERLERGGPAWHNPTEKSGKLVWCARSVGTEPHLADVILERVREAAARASSS